MPDGVLLPEPCGVCRCVAQVDAHLYEHADSSDRLQAGFTACDELVIKPVLEPYMSCMATVPLMQRLVEVRMGRACSSSRAAASMSALGGARGYVTVISHGEGATASTLSRSITVSTCTPLQILRGVHPICENGSKAPEPGSPLLLYA